MNGMSLMRGTVTNSKLRDLGARIVSAGALGYLDARALGAVRVVAAQWNPADPVATAILLSLVCLFIFLLIQTVLIILRPPPVAKAAGLEPRLSALLGTWLMTFVVLLPVTDDMPPAFYFASAGLGAVGDALAIYVMLHLGRSFSFMAEARRLVSRGPYALVRHPLYLAEEIALSAGVITHFSIWAVALFAVQLSFQLRRMRNEERVLAAAFPEYRAYMVRTPALIPRLRRARAITAETA